MAATQVGTPVSRVDGPAKVTGRANYSAEHKFPNMAYGYVVSSEIAKGRIASIDTSAALELPGVLQVFTHQNLPRLAQSDDAYRDEVAPPGSPFRPLRDDRIVYSGQPIALVVAENFELARYAATLVHVDYVREEHATDLEKARAQAYVPPPREGIPPPAKPRGNAEQAFAKSEVQFEAEYLAPTEHHNPMEPFATTVLYGEDGKLTVYDKTQGVQNVRNYLCNVFGFSKDNLRVMTPYMGGGFGLGLRPQYNVFLAVLAARELKRSIKLSLTRQQMFTFGHRPATWQRVALGASRDGQLQSLTHDAVAETSRFEDYSEAVVNWSTLLYRCDNTKLSHKLAQLDVYTPCDMRAPGAVWGLFAIESAMDELAVKLGMDPLELRLKNYTDEEADTGKPFSSKNLRACFQTGAEKFGWSKRNPQARSMRDGNLLVGWGMACGSWEAMQFPASAKAVLTADGKLTVSSATEDIGTGTYTAMTQIAADASGVPIEDVTFQLGDSSFPDAPVEGGSFTVSSVGSAVKAACEKVREKLMDAAGGKNRSVAEMMRATKLDRIEERASVKADEKREKYACYSHAAIFAEVKIDPELGTIRVARVVNAVAGGKIINPKTARSQILGGIVWGIGMALEEESVIDQTFGRFINHNFTEYHVPVNADIRDLDVIFVEEKDGVVNPLGAKGLGEIGEIGVAAAIANAVFHASGKRIRDLPITLDKLL